MGNAGFSRDKQLLDKMIRERKLLIVTEHPWSVLGKIKNAFNGTILRNEVKQTNSYLGGSGWWHTAWQYRKNALFVINKLRQQNWYWEPIEQKFIK